MKYYLKEWTNEYVSVMDEYGQVVGNFVSIEDAIEAYDCFDCANDDFYSDGLLSADSSTIGL